jgi:hypothetical protein
MGCGANIFPDKTPAETTFPRKLKLCGVKTGASLAKR